MNSNAVFGELYIKQSTGLPSLKLTKPYDLVLAALSWEQRSSASLQSIDLPLDTITLVKFASASAEIEQQKLHHLSNFKKLTKVVNVIEMAGSTEFEHNSRLIFELLQTKMQSIGRPLRILLDITCLPKSYLIYLLGASFKSGLVSRLDCVYAEGKYALDISHAQVGADADARQGIISEGEWSSLRIPYFEADSSFPSGRDLFVAMGGEVGLSLPFLERYEPTRLGLILISESLVQSPQNLPEGERLALSTMLSFPNVTRSDVELADLVKFAKTAVSFCNSSNEEVVTGIAIGSKPHALALGVAALHQPNMEVVCRVPKSYRPLDVAAAGRFSLYEIEDRFEPTAYLVD